MNRALMSAGMVDLVQVTIFPVITGRSGVDPVFAGGGDYDLDLVESRTLDRDTLKLIYEPRGH